MTSPPINPPYQKLVTQRGRTPPRLPLTKVDDGEPFHYFTIEGLYLPNKAGRVADPIQNSNSSDLGLHNKETWLGMNQSVPFQYFHPEIQCKSQPFLQQSGDNWERQIRSPLGLNNNNMLQSSQVSPLKPPTYPTNTKKRKSGQLEIDTVYQKKTGSTTACMNFTSPYKSLKLETTQSGIANVFPTEEQQQQIAGTGHLRNYELDLIWQESEEAQALVIPQSHHSMPEDSYNLQDILEYIAE